MEKFERYYWYLIFLPTIYLALLEVGSIFSRVIQVGWVALIVFYLFFAKYHSRSIGQKVVVGICLPLAYLSILGIVIPVVEFLAKLVINSSINREVKFFYFYILDYAVHTLLASILVTPIIYKISGTAAPLYIMISVFVTSIPVGFYKLSLFSLLSLSVCYFTYGYYVARVHPNKAIKHRQLSLPGLGLRPSRL